MKESDIRPADIFDAFLLLAQNDIHTYFGCQDEFEELHCPACDGAGKYCFTKYTFAYRECGNCHTLFASPRPPAKSFARYYQDSDSAKYWATTFYKETATARRDKLWRPKALMVQQLIERFGTVQHSLIDIGGGYGIFAEEFEKISGKKVVVIEPGPFLATACRDRGIEVIQGFLEGISLNQLPLNPKVFVSFELFEHLHDPVKFLNHLHTLMQSGDLFIFTTLSSSGVDIQALWDNSKSVSPPHHLNFINPKSAQILLKRIGYNILEITTPGKLDIDILCNNYQYIKDRFWKTFIIQASDEEKRAMQKYISDNCLSSHMLVVCQKP